MTRLLAAVAIAAGTTGVGAVLISRPGPKSDAARAAVICRASHERLEALPGLLFPEDILAGAAAVARETRRSARALAKLDHGAPYSQALLRQSRLVEALVAPARRGDEDRLASLQARIQDNADRAQVAAARLSGGCATKSHQPVDQPAANPVV